MTLMMMMSMTMSDRGRHIGQASQVVSPVKDLLTPPISKFLVSVLVKVTTGGAMIEEDNKETIPQMF